MAEDWRSLVCMECGYTSFNKQAIDQLIDMAKHWKRTHDDMPIFDKQTWHERFVRPLNY